MHSFLYTAMGVSIVNVFLDVYKSLLIISLSVFDNAAPIVSPSQPQNESAIPLTTYQPVSAAVNPTVGPLLMCLFSSIIQCLSIQLGNACRYGVFLC